MVGYVKEIFIILKNKGAQAIGLVCPLYYNKCTNNNLDESYINSITQVLNFNKKALEVIVIAYSTYFS